MPHSDLLDASDSLLVERSVEGDTHAFEVLLHRHAGLMRAYAARLTGSTADADDVVQDAFITAWNQLDTLVDPSSVKSWLMRIVSRKAIDRIRARRSDTGIDDWDSPTPTIDNPEQQTIVRSQLDAVAGILASLPHLQRQCWILKEVGGYSYQDIADELGTPLTTVRGALSRARQALLRGMEDWK